MGCSKSKVAEPDAALATTADAALVTVASPATDGGYASAATAASALNPRLPINGRLSIEAGNRPGPNVHPTSEEVFAAFAKAGLKMQEPRQHLAKDYAARFCMGQKSADTNVGLSVCEYATEAEATAGRDQSATIFKDIANRSVYRNKATTLAVVETSKNPEDDALVKKLVAVFTSL
jgi:hypothetical protein